MLTGSQDWSQTRRFSRLMLLLAVVLTLTAGVSAQEQSTNRAEREKPGSLGRLPVDLRGWNLSYYGVTRQDEPLPFWYTDHDLDPATHKLRVLIVAPLDSSADLTKQFGEALRGSTSAERLKTWREQISLSVVPWTGRAAGSDEQGEAKPVAWRFPPAAPYYANPQSSPANYLWRWIGTHAPDLVVEVRLGNDTPRWSIGPASELAPLGEPPSTAWGDQLAKALSADRTAGEPARLATALGRESPSDLGSIPAIVCRAPAASLTVALDQLLDALIASKLSGSSPARREWQVRLARTPLEVLSQLSRHYGQSLPAVEYIPAMALVGRLRLGALANDPTQRADVLRIVTPYLKGEKPTTPKSGSGQSGHLIFAELAQGADDAERATYVRLARVAADQAFGADGAPLASMPFHLEMSDAFFMGGPILAAAGRLTAEPKYFEACDRHFEFMRKLDLRSDGLYRHSPLDESAWGRGNGFVALGLGLSIQQWPAERDDRAKWIRVHDAHLKALLPHQDPTGCWHQVVDRPESFRELSCTCMITWAMARGVRGGWLDRATYDSAIRRGWRAIQQRVAPNGRLIDVCTGTGKMKSLREYYDREAILGPDPRGGAMSMLVSAEMVEYFKLFP